MNIAVAGAGKLGSALAAVLAQRHDVTVYDTDPAPVDAINHGIAPTDEPGLAERIAIHGRRADNPAMVAEIVAAATRPADRAVDNAAMVPLILRGGTLWATTDITEAARAEVVFIVVPTPSDDDGRFSNEYVLDVVRGLNDAWKASDVERTVVVVSTVMPGSCGGVIRQALDWEHSLAYSPQFVALGSVIHDMTHPDVILLGSDDGRGVDVVESILVSMVDPPLKTGTRVHRMSLVEAELAKLSLNVALAVKAAYGNEVAHVAEALGADATKVLASVGNDSRIGPALLQVGPTAAGPCIPRDAVAFQRVGSDARVSTFMAHGADQTHRVEPQRVLDRLTWMANGEEPVIGILGVAYKPESAVSDASIGLRVAERALRRALFVYVHDPKARPDIAGAVWRDSAQAVVDAADVILLATPWPEYATLDFRGKPVLDLWGIAPEAKGVHRFGDGTG